MEMIFCRFKESENIQYWTQYDLTQRKKSYCNWIQIPTRSSSTQCPMPANIYLKLQYLEQICSNLTKFLWISLHIWSPSHIPDLIFCQVDIPLFVISWTWFSWTLLVLARSALLPATMTTLSPRLSLAAREARAVPTYTVTHFVTSMK